MTLPWAIVDWQAAWADFESATPPDQRHHVERFYTEQEVIGQGHSDRVLSCSLYCKPSDTGVPWETPTPESVHRLRVRGGRLTWWDAYASPLLRNLHALPYVRPGTDVHLYLASDMTWMIKHLRLPRVVIHVMHTESLTACPGMMWRYLAHDLPGVREVQYVDIEDPWSFAHWKRRMDEWRESGLALFRYMSPSEWDPVVPDLVIYRPVSGGYHLVRPQADFSMFRAAVAFTWLGIQNRIPTRMQHPVRGDVPLFGHRWPDYGFDETFLQHVVYPFFLDRGISTNYDRSNSETLFIRDTMAAAQACPRAMVTQGL